MRDYKNKKVEESMFDILASCETFRYQMLSRMQQDCKYFLGYGNRNEKNLWAGEVSDHIKCMMDLHDSFPEEGKPEWLTYDEIVEFEQVMTGKGLDAVAKIKSETLEQRMVKAKSKIDSDDKSDEKDKQVNKVAFSK